jgi:colicin import membrane protein
MAARVKAAPVEEPEEDEFEEMDEVEDDDLEELEEEEPEEAPKPKTRRTKAKADPTAEEGDVVKPKRKAPTRPEIQYSSAWLAAHVTEKTGETYDARGIRMLLRKLAKDGKLSRVVGEDRNRYEFTGPSDQTVKDVLDFVTSGAAKELKQAGLQAVKDKAAEKKAAARAAREAAAAEAAEVEAEAEDVEDDELEEEAPAPKPAVRRRAAAPAKAAPAKATPAARRRAPAKP